MENPERRHASRIDKPNCSTSHQPHTNRVQRAQASLAQGIARYRCSNHNWLDRYGGEDGRNLPPHLPLVPESYLADLPWKRPVAQRLPQCSPGSMVSCDVSHRIPETKRQPPVEVAHFFDLVSFFHILITWLARLPLLWRRLSLPSDRLFVVKIYTNKPLRKIGEVFIFI